MPKGRPVKRRKRGHGEGSLVKRKINGNTYWCVRVSLPDGSRSKSKYFKTLDAARIALLEIRSDMAIGVLPSDLTFAEWSGRWLANKRGVKSRTAEQYRRNISKACVYFGSRHLSKIGPIDLELMNTALLDTGLSSTSVRQVFVNVGTCLRAAYKNGFMDRDIASLADAPVAKKRQPVVLSRDQWQRLLDASRESDRGLIVEFLLKSAMRINEALSTTWAQVDFDRCQITVGDSKTAAGQGRIIPTDASLIQRLQTLRQKHLEKMELIGGEWNESGLIFCTEEGNRNSRQNLQQRVLTKMLLEAGLPHLTWHHLRHNAGSYLLSERVPLTVVSKVLGHKSTAITANVYAHELQEDFDQVRVAMAKFG